MKKIKLFLLPFLIIATLSAQNTFNKQYHFDGLAAIGNGLLVTDSCYSVSGLVVDSINTAFYDALFLAKMDFSGNITSSYTLLDTLNSFENWATPLMFHDSAFTSIGYGKDSLMYLYWLRIDRNNNLIGFNKFRSYYSPEDHFIRPLDVVYARESKKYYILTLIGKYEADGSLNQNYTVLALDKNGEFQWEQDYGGLWSNKPGSLLLRDNEIIIGSKRANSNLTRWDLRLYSKIIAIDTLGQLQWSWQSAHNVVEQGANDIVATEDGGLVVASARGYLESVNAEAKRILWDRAVIFKLDNNQQIVWETEFTEPAPTGTHNNKLSQIIDAGDDSGYVAAGNMVFWLSEDNASKLGWLIKVSPQGDSLWSRKLFYYEYPDSLEYEHDIHDLQATPDGGYLMSGQTLDRNQISTPIQQAWFIKVDAEGCLIPGCGLVDAIEPSPEEGPALLLYPNPTSDYLNVYLGKSGGKKWSFVVYNSIGQEMGRYAAGIGHTTYMIAVDRWPAGQYYLRVVDDNGQVLKGYPWVKI